ncbi:outer membrane protein assembly factor BamA [Parabacteroides sp. PFB2-12]|uniref:porin family protein n=1 Tax=Parabacteroides sp. PFB2-12 TaxID=2940652 RepID=UPI00247431AC|nr:porin family protein [Parabacteroides sp. PFB2-12]MDH6389652.1 outer membrane protein assembly factor BamA [Parabacteroides sp. PFB2-12]
MKKVFSLLVVLLVTSYAFTANAQLRFGLKGGVNISTVHFSDVRENWNPNNVTGFHIGPMIEATVPLLGLGFDAALLYTQKGMEPQGVEIGDTKIGDDAIKIDYIDVPIHLRWKIDLPLIKPYLATGPYFGFRLSKDKVWSVLEDQIKAKTFGMGWDFGAGVELFNHLQVGFNYGLGLTDNYKLGKKEGGKNRGWMISAAIMF